MSRSIASLILLGLASGIAVAGDTDALFRGKEAADALNKALRERLEAAATGPDLSGAFAVSSYQAQTLIAEFEQRMGVRIKRTSLKLRNPKNAPDGFEQAVLDRFESSARAGSNPDAVLEECEFEGKKAYRYAQPVFVGMHCVACHGAAEDLRPDVRKVLGERYPGDRATGYRSGDLRGIVSVVIPSE